MRRKVILDVDTGHDDAMAILLAAAHQSLDLQAITVTAGNQVLEKTVANTIDVCSLAGISVPIYAGMARPLVREPLVSDFIHGDSGLGSVVFPPAARKAESEHAVDFLIRACLEADGDLTLIPVAPLSNIAMALLREPNIKRGIKEIILMGGSIGVGNFTPAAEFNIYADPEAAKIVFESGVPITMIGLELTHQAMVSPEVAEEVRMIGTPVAHLVTQLLSDYGEAYRQLMGFSGPPVHDVCAVAYAIDPSLIETTPMRVDIETTPGLCYGRTVCDFYGITGREPNADVALTLDQRRFWPLFVEALRSY
ncbi:MAG: nucleoside hydrolase [Limnochordia bacterium]